MSTVTSQEIQHAPTSSIGRRPGQGLSALVRNALTLGWRNVTITKRQPQLVMYALVEPIIILLLFRYVLGGSIVVPGLDYVDYLVPGILVASLAFGSISTAVGFAEDIHAGVIDRLRTLPLQRSVVIVGRLFADAFRIMIVIAMLIGIGYAVGFNFTTDAAHVAGFIAVAFLIGIVYTSIAILLGSFVGSPEAAASAGTVVVMPLIFCSSALVSPASMPKWLRIFAHHNPVSRFVNALRGLALGGPVATPIYWALAWSLLIITVCGFISVRHYGKR